MMMLPKACKTNPTPEIPGGFTLPANPIRYKNIAFKFIFNGVGTIPDGEYTTNVQSAQTGAELRNKEFKSKKLPDCGYVWESSTFYKGDDFIFFKENDPEPCELSIGLAFNPVQDTFTDDGLILEPVTLLSVGVYKDNPFRTLQDIIWVFGKFYTSDHGIIDATDWTPLSYITTGEAIDKANVQVQMVEGAINNKRKKMKMNLL